MKSKEQQQEFMVKKKIFCNKFSGGSGFRNMEFTAPKGCVILPKWMMSNLFIKEGETVDVRSVKLSKVKKLIL